jgi:hypothetical protein
MSGKRIITTCTPAGPTKLQKLFTEAPWGRERLALHDDLEDFITFRNRSDDFKKISKILRKK